MRRPPTRNGDRFHGLRPERSRQSAHRTQHRAQQLWAEPAVQVAGHRRARGRDRRRLVCAVPREGDRSGDGNRRAVIVERRRQRRRGAERVRIRRRAASGHGLLEGHGQGRRGADRGRHGRQGRPVARAARRHDDPPAATRSSQRQLDAARKNLNEVEVRVAEAERNLRRTRATAHRTSSCSELQLDRRSRKSRRSTHASKRCAAKCRSPKAPCACARRISTI